MREKSCWNGSRVLVTGGAGFLGSHLVDRLVSGGADVTVMDQHGGFRNGNLTPLSSDITFLEADINILSWSELLRARSFEYIYHLAGSASVPRSVQEPQMDYQLNLWSTFRLLEALRKLSWRGRLVYASSAAVYGDPVRMPITEGDPTIPISPYGVSRLSAERYLSVFSALYGLHAAALRFFSVYGPRQSKQVVFEFTDRLMHDASELSIYGDGSQTRDFLYVQDAVRAAMLVAERGPLQGEVYNAATGKSYAIRELVTILCRILGVNPRLNYSGAVRQGEPQKWSVNIGRLEELGFRATVSLEEGLGHVAEWYKRAYPVRQEIQRAY